MTEEVKQRGTKRSRRRVTVYSRVDEQRIAAGKPPLGAEPELDEQSHASFTSNDERLLRDVPPHYGS